MTTEADFLQAVVADPTNATETWLIFADWLEERGDPRCELLRLEHGSSSLGPAERQRRIYELIASGMEPLRPRFTNSIGMEFAWIPAGSFLMGSPETEDGHYVDEVLHKVTLTEPYWLGVYPVTVVEFQYFVEAADYETEAERGSGVDGFLRRNWDNPGFAQTGRHPVTCVSWNDAQALVQWLNEQEGGRGWRYSLPSEAQWERACRAGSKTAYCFGDDPRQLGDYAWFEDNSGDTTHPAGSKRPNLWGLHDLHGNVWEWCESDYRPYPTAVGTNPGGAAFDEEELYWILRGGSWGNYDDICRAATRFNFHSSVTESNLGIRLAAVPTGGKLRERG